MAGSYNHCLDDDGNYRGSALLENMGDMAEAVEEMFFMIRFMGDRWAGERLIQDASDAYFECLRGERPWPEWMKRTAATSR